MILKLDCVYGKRRIKQFLGTVGRAELYAERVNNLETQVRLIGSPQESVGVAI